MAQGRGNVAIALVVLYLLAVAFQCEVAHAATYVVGDSNGWMYGASGWENDKNFNAGDILVFNYLTPLHNVVVNKEGYDECSIMPSDAKVYTSGKDQISFEKGLNNFICSISHHCGFSMKIQIYIP